MSELALALTDDKVPAHIAKGNGRGNEDVNGSSLTIPRIKQLQKMSDEVDKHHPNHIKGAGDGVFMNTLTRELYGEELYCINIKFKDEFVVWKDREKGGGLLGTYKTQAEAQEAVSATEKPDDYAIRPTHTHLLLIKNPETGELSAPVLMDFAASKLKPSKNWNSQINIKGGDRFAGLWKLTSIPVTVGNNTWMNLDIDFVGWTMADDYKLAEEIFEQFENTAL